MTAPGKGRTVGHSSFCPTRSSLMYSSSVNSSGRSGKKESKCVADSLSAVFDECPQYVFRLLCSKTLNLRLPMHPALMSQVISFPNLRSMLSKCMQREVKFCAGMGLGRFTYSQPLYGSSRSQSINLRAQNGQVVTEL